MQNNYDNIASGYDFLSRIVFGAAQRDAQTALLSRIPAHSKVLIAGGGTGWILEKMAVICPPSIQICYVEISANMLNLARKKQYAPNEVTFIHAAIEDFHPSQLNTGSDITKDGFDVIITPFLFDNFDAARMPAVFRHLDRMLRPGGQWLFTDFHYQEKAPFWQRLLLNSMYTFFRIIAHVEAKKLTDVEPLFRDQGFDKTYEAFFYGKFIRSAVYQKR